MNFVALALKGHDAHIHPPNGFSSFSLKTKKKTRMILSLKCFLKIRMWGEKSVSCLLAEENDLAKLSNNCPATLLRRNLVKLNFIRKRQRKRKIANVQATLKKVC